MGIPATRDLSKADVAIIGVPFDLGVSYRPGARFGPRGIRDASGQMYPHGRSPEELHERFRSLRVIDYGDLNVPYAYIDEAVRFIESSVDEVSQADVFPIFLGGDHTISLPIMRSLFKKHGKMSLVHIDAHPDFWEPPEGMPYNHGTTFRIASDEGIIEPRRSVLGAPRGNAAATILDDVREAGITVVTTDDVAELGVKKVLETIKNAAGNPPVYISLDIDSADPAFALGTGTPEVAGLTSRELVWLVRGLRGIGAVALDIVEVAPPYDSAEITSLLAANLVYEFLLTMVPDAPNS